MYLIYIYIYKHILHCIYYTFNLIIVLKVNSFHLNPLKELVSANSAGDGEAMG